MTRTAARAALLDTFRWAGDHADVWRVLARADALAAVVTCSAAAGPWD